MSEWIGWSGGDCPVDASTIVEVEIDGFASGYDASRADDWLWHHDGEQDITAYRVVTPFQKPAKESTTPPKDTMKIYCDNFLALTKALENAGGNAAAILRHNSDFLETLARNHIEIDAKYLGEGV